MWYHLLFAFGTLINYGHSLPMVLLAFFITFIYFIISPLCSISGKQTLKPYVQVVLPGFSCSGILAPSGSLFITIFNLLASFLFSPFAVAPLSVLRSSLLSLLDFDALPLCCLPMRLSCCSCLHPSVSVIPWVHFLCSFVVLFSCGTALQSSPSLLAASSLSILTFLAALSSSWSLVVCPLVRPLVRPSVRPSVRSSVCPSVYLCEKVIFRVSNESEWVMEWPSDWVTEWLSDWMTKILWLKFCYWKFETEILWLKFCDWNFVTQIL